MGLQTSPLTRIKRQYKFTWYNCSNIWVATGKITLHVTNRKVVAVSTAIQSGVIISIDFLEPSRVSRCSIFRCIFRKISLDF
jgi:hypothetical protein